MTTKRKTSWEIAREWYKEEHIAEALQNAKIGVGEAAKKWDVIPGDVRSPEFAAWLTHQYRLAMAKGIQLERNEMPHAQIQTVKAEDIQAVRKFGEENG